MDPTKSLTQHIRSHLRVLIARFHALLGMVAEARSRPVRTWAAKLLTAEHRERLADLEPDRLRPLLDHPDPLVNEFAASLFLELTTLDRLTVAEWLDLLDGDNQSVLALIAAAMEQRVTPDRVGLADAARLALAAAVPVAKLRLHFLGDREPAVEDERLIVSCLSGARCAALGSEIATWALARLDTPERYNTEDVIEFFDADLREVRDGAWA